MEKEAKIDSSKNKILREKIISLFFIFVLYGIAFIIFVVAASTNGDRIVYITATGECYHRSGCSSILQSKFETTIEDAVSDGFRRCENCDPPDLKANDRKFRIPLYAYIYLVPMSMFVEWFFSSPILYFFGIDPRNICLLWHFIPAVVFWVTIDTFL